MSTAEEIEEAFEIEGEIVDDENLHAEVDGAENDEQDEVVEQQETPKTGADKMFIDKETWVKQGRDPELWVSPDVFRERTERIKLKSQMNQQAKDFERRLQLNNRLHQVQFDKQRQELESRKENAILEADTKEVKRIDKELRDIDDLEQSIKPVPVPVPQSNLPPEIIEWNSKNAWLTEDHPYREQINAEYARALNDGSTVAGALIAVELFAIENGLKPVKGRTMQADASAQKKQPRSMVDSSKGGAVVKSQSNLSWESLSSQEKSIYDELFADAGVSKKEYLQSVADSKKGL